MAFFTGHDGVVKITGEGVSAQTIGNLRNFTIDQTQDAIETTVMNTTGGYRTYQPGLSTFTVSGDMYFDANDTAQIALDDFVSQVGGDTIGSIDCYPSGDGVVSAPNANAKLSGDFIFTSFSITSSVDGIVECSFSGQGTGALTTTIVS